jgi:hypothetical protein
VTGITRQGRMHQLAVMNMEVAEHHMNQRRSRVRSQEVIEQGDKQRAVPALALHPQYQSGARVQSARASRSVPASPCFPGRRPRAAYVRSRPIATGLDQRECPVHVSHVDAHAGFADHRLHQQFPRPSWPKPAKLRRSRTTSYKRVKNRSSSLLVPLSSRPSRSPHSPHSRNRLATW